MEERIISKATAVLAKSKEFGKWNGSITNSIYVHAKYFNKKPSGYNIQDIGVPLYISGYDNLITNYLDQDIFTYAPTQSLLQKWIREVHRINIIITSTHTYYTICLLKYDSINDHNQGNPLNGMGLKDYKSYEDALEEALIFSLNIL